MAASALEHLERETLAEQAVRSLKRFIVAEALQAGAQLPSERELSETLGISRNVVREALRTLVAEGYVSKEAGRGVFVRRFDPQQIESELYAGLGDQQQERNLRELRAALEIGAMPFVVRRVSADELARLRQIVAGMSELFQAGKPLTALDREFHQTLIAAARNPELDALRRNIVRSLRLRAFDGPGARQSARSRDENTLRTAEQLLKALESRDVEGAERAMRAHLFFDLPPAQARLFLFVDDGDIASMHGLTRSVRQAAKHYGNPVLMPEQPWEGEAIMPSATVLFDEDRQEFRLWYAGYRYLSSLDEQYSLCYATSVDGVHWRRPALGLVEFDGSTQNNLLIPWGDPRRHDTTSATIFYDPSAEDASRRYIMVYFCSGLYPLGLGLAFSSDGLRWQPHPDNPLDSGGQEPIGDVLYAMLEPRGKRMAAYYRVRQRVRPRRTLARAESQDMLHWSGHRVILEADEHDPPDAEMLGLTPFRYGDMILGFLWVSTENGRKVEVQLASSRDGATWQRVGDRRPFLTRGAAGAFDENSVSRVTVPVVMGDELWFYYEGRGDARRRGIGLATVKMDRFISLDAGEAEGELLTRPLTITDQTKLLINAVANPGGYVLAEVLDQEGRPIAGFTREDAILFQDSAVFHPFAWAGQSDLSALAGQVVQIRFILRKARLYAFRLCRPDAAMSDLVAGIC